MMAELIGRRPPRSVRGVDVLKTERLPDPVRVPSVAKE